MMLVAAVPVTVGILVHRYPAGKRFGTIVIGALLTVLVLGGVAGQLSQVPVQGTWSDAVEQAAAACTAGADGVVELVTTPAGNWAVPVPCARIVG